jgi:hypothetical protein
MQNRERRRHNRNDMCKPAKVYCVETGRYLSGRTSNWSAGGVLVQVDHPSLLVAGQQVRVGIAWDARRPVLGSADLVSGTVVRSLGLGGQQNVAVRFVQAQPLAAAG